MTVDPFWFGILMAIVAEIVLVILLGIIKSLFGKNEREDYEIKQVDLPPEIEETLIREIKKYEEGLNDKDK